MIAIAGGAMLGGALPAVAAPATSEETGTTAQQAGTHTHTDDGTHLTLASLPQQDRADEMDGVHGRGEDEDDDDHDDHDHEAEELVSPELAEFDEQLAEQAEEIEELREEAGKASQRHERLRRKEARHQADLIVLGEKLERERIRLEALRTMIGKQASSQYRAGGGAELARLMFSESPEAFLNNSSLIGRGELTAMTLMERTQESELALGEAETEARELRAATKKVTREQEKIREEVEEKLEEAEERLEELEEAKAAALEKLRAEREARRRAAEKDDEPLPDLPATTDGECAVSVRDSERLAKPAVEEDWTAPIDEAYTLTAGYGRSGHRWSSTHTGQDFAVPTGTPVLTVGSGTVVGTGCQDAFGHAVVIEHDNGYYSQYAHLSVIEVEVGQEVGVGQRIGLSGNTGNSSGPHLHFEIRLTPYIGSAINPVPWLSDHGVEL
ncbi:MULTISPECIES: M23 family metallopeptidase [unclassified Streptomyces]|uniref:M23 family metallopeptidase n=1 Tax=unclassified Streptomyces TaxID=2593676 RepID=UPI000CD5BC0F|nr:MULTISPECIES: M23 family metallopeptidase [unclassified Streptomyces]